MHKHPCHNNLGLYRYDKLSQYHNVFVHKMYSFEININSNKYHHNIFQLENTVLLIHGHSLHLHDSVIFQCVNDRSPGQCPQLW